MSPSAPYHPGELAVHARAGLVEQAAISQGAIHTVLPPAAAAFLAEQPMLVLSAADPVGRMWASLVTGRPGFVRARGDHSVDVSGRPAPGDPLAAVLDRPAKIGVIAIEPTTRRRMRVNGRSQPTANGLTITADQVYANCPKYIQKRSAGPADDARLRQPVHVTAELGAAQQQLIAVADTCFVATQSAGGDADASHRGGNPGFVQVLSGSTLSWPDYVGNAMMMTLGNLEQNPAAGLLFIDWDTGTTLQLTGIARVDWEPARTAQIPGAQRVVDFRLTQVVQIEHNSPLSWGSPGFSRFNPPVPGASAAFTGDAAC